jgi:hypothetical protein
MTNFGYVSVTASTAYTVYFQAASGGGTCYVDAGYAILEVDDLP